jgi:hypothetical protein
VSDEQESDWVVVSKQANPLANEQFALVDAEPEPEPEPPPPFDWNTAHDLLHRGGHERAMVLGLSLISDQLDYIARRLK